MGVMKRSLVLETEAGYGSFCLLWVVESFIITLGNRSLIHASPSRDGGGWETGKTKCKAKLIPLCRSKEGPRVTVPLMTNMFTSLWISPELE